MYKLDITLYILYNGNWAFIFIESFMFVWCFLASLYLVPRQDYVPVMYWSFTNFQGHFTQAQSLVCCREATNGLIYGVRAYTVLL